MSVSASSKLTHTCTSVRYGLVLSRHSTDGALCTHTRTRATLHQGLGKRREPGVLLDNKPESPNPFLRYRGAQGSYSDLDVQRGLGRRHAAGSHREREGRVGRREGAGGKGGREGDT